MLGRIIGIEEETLILNISDNLENVQSAAGKYVSIKDSDKEYVGEVASIKEGFLRINLLGEIRNNKFVYGVTTKPSFNSQIGLISEEKVPMILSVDNYVEKRDVIIGESPVYSGVKIGFNINDFFANHFAIFGNTGSGKSWGTARVIQSIFDKKETTAYRASIFIFDAYGEYHSAFKNIGEKSSDLSFKAYTTNVNMSDTEILKIPLWLLSLDDITILLGAEKNTQIPIIEKAMKLVGLFVRNEEDVIKPKNDIIARAILDILSSGKSSAQIRDQIFSVLSTYNTKELNLETEIYQPGYVRSLKQCLIIDNTGKIREMELITNFMNSFLDNSYELVMPDGTFKYGLKDLEKALEFALLSEGALNSSSVYDENNIIKVRLHTLVNGDYARYFDCDEFMTVDEYIKDLLTAPNGKKAQIINFNINYVDDRFAKIITKIYSRLLFDYAKNLNRRASLPFHIVLEEAHRYVQNDNDVNLIGYNIFDRITKEGRKYGVLLGLISQRPSDLSETSISQCSNFLIFKMIHPRDVKYIRDMVPNITDEVVKKLKVLQPGNCMAFGSAFKVPVLVKLYMPSPSPSSASCDISAIWFVDKKGSSSDTSPNGLFADKNVTGRVVYRGQSVKNYLLFNGEMWRIIYRDNDGVYKIVRDSSLGNASFDSSGSSDWSKPCSLNAFLNGKYLNSLNDASKSFICNHNFSIGPNSLNLSLVDTIKNEDSRVCLGNVGLLNLSDYLNSFIGNESYIKNMFVGSTIWLMSSEFGSDFNVLKISDEGVSFDNAVSSNGVIPVVYLRPGIRLSGIGTKDDPYRF